MCSIALFFSCFDELPLLVAANRDERLDRRASPPLLWTERDPLVIAPRDDEAGGTWVGINEAGLFVGITNRFGSSRDATRRSRGELVLRALRESSAEEAFAQLQKVTARDYNPFHLVMADRGAARVVWSDGGALHLRELAPGLHTFTERSFGAAPTSRDDRIATLFGEVLGLQRVPTDDELVERLGQHGRTPLDGPCVHFEALNYGTRSVTIVRGTANSVEPLTLAHAEGPACEPRWVETPRFADDPPAIFTA